MRPQGCTARRHVCTSARSSGPRSLAGFSMGLGHGERGEEAAAGPSVSKRWRTGRSGILTASTEIGQGTKTIFCQLAADALAVGLDKVVLAPQDHRSFPTPGRRLHRRTAMIVGRLVQEAAQEVKERLKREKVPLRVDKSYIQPTRFTGTRTPTAATLSGLRLGVHDCGRRRRHDDGRGARDRSRHRGRLWQGRSIPSWPRGRSKAAACRRSLGDDRRDQDERRGYQNDRLATYLIPPALDAPRIRTILVENPYSAAHSSQRDRRASDGWTRARHYRCHPRRDRRLAGRNSGATRRRCSRMRFSVNGTAVSLDVGGTAVCSTYCGRTSTSPAPRKAVVRRMRGHAP